MKQAPVKVWIAKEYGDGETYINLFATEDEARDYIYEQVKEQWEYNFDEDDINDYTRDEAISHYYEYSDNNYDIDSEVVHFPMIYLQDQIAKAMGLVSNG